MSFEAHRAVLVLGGIRSGKSGYAESLVPPAADTRYVATAAPRDGDPEWAARLAAHRDRRPEHWLTEETGTEPARLPELIAETKPDQTVLVDDLGGWVAAQPSGADPAALVAAVRDCAGRVILVSPEVGLSVVPPTAAGVAFADALGTVNRALAEVCDLVLLVVAGQPVVLKQSTARRPALAAAPPVEDDDLAIEPGLSLPIPDQAASVAATERLAGLDVPGAGLGRLTEVVGFAAGAQGTAEPVPYRSVRALVLHGTYRGGLATGDDTDEWRRRLREVAEGGGPVGLLAAQAGAAVQVVEVVPVTGPVEETDALSPDEVDRALRYGYRLAESAVDSGVDLLVLAAGGPGHEAAAVAVIAALTGAEAPGMLPRVRRPGARYDDLAWMARVAAIRDALHRTAGRTRQPKDLLAALGGAGLAVAMGVLLGASARRTPVVIDGPVGVAAALLARDLATQTRLWLLLADHGGHPAVRTGADRLSLTPVTDLGLGLGEGTSALATLPLIQSALLVAGTARVSIVDSRADHTTLADPDTIRA
jgi:nicotinate-nucleotide--dimethylbenzimidazole phosphoribosyltransferase